MPASSSYRTARPATIARPASYRPIARPPENATTLYRGRRLR